MKQKKIVAILIIVAALGGGLYLYQKNKQKKALAVHNKLKFQQMTTAAKKNRYAGLIAMASAINKYHQVKDHYPINLLDLYPEFIPVKSFISTLNWKYNPKNGSYLITKSIKDQRIFASMGPDLKLITGRDASGAQPKAIVAFNKPNSQKIKITKTVALKNLKTKPDINKHTKFIATVKKASSPDIKKTLRGVKTADERKITRHKPSVRIVKKELDEDEKFLLSFDGSRLYIWKTKDGILGFSDIQYPDKRQLTVYRDRSWIEYGADQNTIVK
jgi:hypothetical protein